MDYKSAKFGVDSSSIFTAKRYASTVYAMALCLCVSVRLKSEFHKNGSMA